MARRTFSIPIPVRIESKEQAAEYLRGFADYLQKRGSIYNYRLPNPQLLQAEIGIEVKSFFWTKTKRLELNLSIPKPKDPRDAILAGSVPEIGYLMNRIHDLRIKTVEFSRTFRT